MTSKTILEYRSRDIVLIPVIWMFPNQNPTDEDEACSMQSTCKLKVFYAMTDHDLGTPKSGFWKGGNLGSLFLSLEVENICLKPEKPYPNP